MNASVATAPLQGQYKSFRPIQGPLQIGESPRILVEWTIPAWEGEVSREIVSLSPVPGRPGKWEADHYIGLLRAVKARNEYYRDDWTGKLECSSSPAIAATGESYRIRFSPATGEIEVLLADGLAPVNFNWGYDARAAAAKVARAEARKAALGMELPAIPALPCDGHVSMRGQVFPPGSISARMEIVAGYEGDTLSLEYVEGWPIPSNHSVTEERYRKVAAVWDGEWRMGAARDCWLGRYKSEVRAMVRVALGMEV